MQRSELGHWLRLAGTPEVGSDTARRLLTAFGTPEAVFAQSPQALAQVVTPLQRQHLLQVDARHAALLDSTWRWLQDATVAERRVLTLGDADYPGALLNMADPPLLLHAMGRFDAWPGFIADPTSPPGIAIVGSRNPTPQGLVNAHNFARHICEAGWTVVSGLALGVDRAAHEGALEGAAAQPGMLATVAVVGTGLDRVYPRRNLQLAHAIARHGVILSEYLLGTPPLAPNFPRRNRLIAGLTRGTLVVEAALKSGSLITARLASEQGKEVFAIPGSIHAPMARGCHALIKQGAKLVETVDDVLDEFAPAAALRRPLRAPTQAPSAPAADDVLEQIGLDPIGLDALQARTGLDTATLQARLLELELDGHIVRMPGALFQRIVVA
ncbi:DNA-processing protein DprA [Pseudorhodoferax sp. Leaf267]|uniref:DNA-processing protein DprA n=1 Tax=Pseudorhodoferax sp. Leaf267 TaxID=1736316 RepID=UPI0006F2DCD1|nr:DNA-processing protein DprA [Pseudorhodoferax sp. Leaf267]KQP12529.1 DNA processing protein DprA [Pseudorhodoferax sp. Leaf267]